MPKQIPNEVDMAFEILIEEIEEVVNEHVSESERALQARNFSVVRKIVDRVELITSYRQKVDAIRKEWETLESIPLRVRAKDSSESTTSRLQKGKRTPEDLYYAPILQSLVELNGSARTADVLDLVGKKMSNILKDVDFESLASHELRWRNTAKWARNTLVQQGLMKSDSEHGIWEITHKGRESLR